MSTASGPAPPAAAGAGWRLEYPLPPDADVHDELLAPDGALRPQWSRFGQSLARLGPQEMARRWDQARRLLRENGVTYNVYGDPRGIDRPWELDPMPLLLAARRVGGARSRTRAARAAAEPDPRRSLRAAAPAARRPAAARAGVGAPGLPAPVPRHRRAGRRAGCTSTPPTWRARPTGAGGCSPIARRRRRARATRSRTASCCRARCPSCSASAACSASPASSARCATRCARLAPRHRENPRIVLLTPGAVQRDLLRARLPRALPRLHAGRGRRPDGARQARLPEDARRPRAGRRDPAPPRRRLLRSARAAHRLVARRPRAGAGGARRQRRGGERARQRPGRDARPARLPARSLPPPARRGAAPAVGRDLVVRPAARARLRARRTSTRWSSSRRSRASASSRSSARISPPPRARR